MFGFKKVSSLARFLKAVRCDSREEYVTTLAEGILTSLIENDAEHYRDLDDGADDIVTQAFKIADHFVDKLEHRWEDSL